MGSGGRWRPGGLGRSGISNSLRAIGPTGLLPAGQGIGHLFCADTRLQWRRQGLMVGEAHLIGEANIFNVK